MIRWYSSTWWGWRVPLRISIHPWLISVLVPISVGWSWCLSRLYSSSDDDTFFVIIQVILVIEGLLIVVLVVRVLYYCITICKLICLLLFFFCLRHWLIKLRPLIGEIVLHLIERFHIVCLMMTTIFATLLLIMHLLVFFHLLHVLLLSVLLLLHLLVETELLLIIDWHVHIVGVTVHLWRFRLLLLLHRRIILTILHRANLYFKIILYYW